MRIFGISLLISCGLLISQAEVTAGGCQIFNTLDAEEAITQFLQQKDPEHRWKVVLDQTNWAVSTEAAPTLQRVDMARSQDRCEAWFALKDGSIQRVSGRLVPVVDVPMLCRAINPGDVIQVTDVVSEPLRADQLGSNVVVTADRLVGMTAHHRLLKPYTPILTTEITPPKVVRKGAEVSLCLHSAHIILIQRRAQALEDGAVGEHIKVCNLESKRVVTGVVKDANTVEVHVIS